MPKREALAYRLVVGLDLATAQRMKTIAKQHDVAPAVIARWAIQSGLTAAEKRARRENAERAAFKALEQADAQRP